MEYRIDIYDRRGLRVGRFHRVPLLEASRTTPDQPDAVRGLLPEGTADLGHGYRVQVAVEGRMFCEADVVRIEPQWSDTRKLILDRYVRFHEVIAFEAVGRKDALNSMVCRGYGYAPIDAIVRDVINAAAGPVHYLVAHGEHPDGAQREYDKFTRRTTAANALPVGAISSGQWAGPDRVDASGAWARDGATIAGLVVDGVAWPDLRLMMVDCEELTKNDRAVERHPEVAGWSAERYARSGYALTAERARQALQDLIDANGVSHVELNPHRDASGACDDRIDEAGRYVGLAYGSGECFNAAMIELGAAGLHLRHDGRRLDPAMRLKEFYSYDRPCGDSVESLSTALGAFEADHGVFDLLTALAYAGGCVWSLDIAGAVHFRAADRCEGVYAYDPVEMGALLASDAHGVVNRIRFEGNPILGPVEKTYARASSEAAYGEADASFRHVGIVQESDADLLVEGVLDDLAYPEACGRAVFHHGETGARVGDLIEFRGAPLRRLDPAPGDEWGGRFAGKLVRRVKCVTHEFRGREIATTLGLTSPLRCVERPLRFMSRRQDSETDLYQFRLDDAAAGLDSGRHLD
jgi:hypothetical protein